ncbi:MAG: ABC transporter substrate-binding protein, partial [Maioricimonas sp. JB049]
RLRRRPLVPALVVTTVLMAVVTMASLLPPSAAPVNTVRVGVKPWVGFAPLVVAARLGLCEETDIELVPVRTTSDVGRRVLAGELEFASYLVDSHALARANRIPTRAILMLDTSLTADGVVAQAGIETFEDLRGKSVAYMHHEAPHFLLLGLCEQHGLELADFRHVKTETAQQAVDAFLSGRADAVVTYEPFLSRAVSERPGSRVVASAADDPGSIIDLLTVREDFLDAHRHKVEEVVRAWFRGLELLQSGDPAALQAACAFLGTDGKPISVEAFREMERGMMYGSRDANFRFFRRNARGSSEFQERMNAAQSRWSAHHQLPRWTDPAEAASDLFLEMDVKR